MTVYLTQKLNACDYIPEGFIFAVLINGVPVTTVSIAKYKLFHKKAIKWWKLTRKCSVNSIKAKGADPTSGWFLGKFTDEDEHWLWFAFPKRMECGHVHSAADLTNKATWSKLLAFCIKINCHSCLWICSVPISVVNYNGFPFQKHCYPLSPWIDCYTFHHTVGYLSHSELC